MLSKWSNIDRLLVDLFSIHTSNLRVDTELRPKDKPVAGYTTYFFRLSVVAKIVSARL